MAAAVAAVRACVRARVCVRACVRACVRVCICVLVVLVVWHTVRDLSKPSRRMSEFSFVALKVNASRSITKRLPESCWLCGFGKTFSIM